MLPGFHDIDLIIVLIVSTIAFGPRTAMLFGEILNFLKRHRDD